MRLRSGSFAAQILIVTALVGAKTEYSSAQVKQPGGFFAQRLAIAAGGSYSPQEKNISAAAGLHFSPQLFLTTTYSDFSVSVTSCPEVLYSLNADGDFSNKLFFQLPTMLHLNIGHLASKDFHSACGFFAGAGWNLQLGQSSNTGGFAWDAGFRFWLLGQSFTIQYMMLPGHEKIFSSGNFFSLNINLGKYLSNVKANNKVSNFVKPYRNKK